MEKTAVEVLGGVASVVLQRNWTGYTVLFYTSIKDVIYVFLKKDSVPLISVQDWKTLTETLPVQDFDLKVVDSYNSLNHKEKTKAFLPQYVYMEFPKQSKEKAPVEFGETVGKKFGPILKEYAELITDKIWTQGE